MPLLQFDTTADVDDVDLPAFADAVTDHYTTEMATDPGHVAVVVRERSFDEMHIGRQVAGPLCFLDAEIRQGRSFERKRAFALAAMAEASDRFGVPDPNLKVVFTEHSGAQMMGVDRVGEDWEA